MTISLPADVQECVEEQVRKGRFGSVDAAVADALRRVQEYDRRVSWLRSELQKGIDSLERGEGEPWDVKEAQRRLVQRLRAEGKKA